MQRLTAGQVLPILKLIVDFLFKAKWGFAGIAVASVWVSLEGPQPIATKYSNLFWWIGNLMLVIEALFSMWSMKRARAKSEEEYQEAGVGAFNLVALLWSLWIALTRQI